MSTTRVIESRRLDHIYDATYTDSYRWENVGARAKLAASVPTMVSGTQRFKFFKRPMMPRMAAVPPQVLLAAAEKAPVQLEEVLPEPRVKSQEVQTMYRESEAQTDPYSPEVALGTGDDPEVLMLEGLTYGNGLPVGPRELAMIAFARKKRELEACLPPFTDEASLAMRRRLMERQEMLELQMREEEIDLNRHERLQTLRAALKDRDEGNQFLAEQKLEALRQRKMEDRERALEHIRKKRIQVLRKLVRRRRNVDPKLSESMSHDTINKYLNKTSEVCVPKTIHNLRGSAKGVVDMVTLCPPLNTLPAMDAFTKSLPSSLMETRPSRTAARASNALTTPRMTAQQIKKSASIRTDIEHMHQSLQAKRTRTINQEAKAAIQDLSSTATRFHSIHKKSRPMTPDYSIAANTRDGLTDAVLLLQRLLRGRSVQNAMFEGRLKNAELIQELRMAEVVLKQRTVVETAAAHAQQRMQRVRQTTIDTIAGGVSVILDRLAMAYERKDNVLSAGIVSAPAVTAASALTSDQPVLQRVSTADGIIQHFNKQAVLEKVVRDSSEFRSAVPVFSTADSVETQCQIVEQLWQQLVPALESELNLAESDASNYEGIVTALQNTLFRMLTEATTS